MAKLKMIVIPSDALGWFLGKHWQTDGFKMTPQIPRDIVLVNVRHGFPNSIEIIISHESFEELQEGQTVPIWDIKFERPI